MKRRAANFELLRIISMMMVVCLHYLSKGNLLPQYIKLNHGSDYLYWLIEALCIVAVNVFVLISGYFLIEKEFDGRKIVRLWMQVLFYSLGIPLVLGIVGVIPTSEWNIYRILPYFFPILTEHYWFATAYLLMYLFVPVLNKGIKGVSKKQLQKLIFMLLAIFSLSKSILPFSLPMDRSGYDFIWFICLYLIAAYIRLYGIPFFKNGRRSAFLYFLSVMAMFGMFFVLGMVYQYTGKLEKFMDASYDYNHILNLAASVSLFYAFSYIKIEKEKWTQMICRISPYVFGVFLLHEHIETRYLWIRWMKVDAPMGVGIRLLHMAGSVILVFALGISVDYIRSRIFDRIRKMRGNKNA